MTTAGRRALVALAAAALTVAVLLAAGGGVRASIGGVSLSARSPIPAVAALVAALAGWLLLAGRSGSRKADAAADLATAWTFLDRRAGWIIACAAAASGATAVFFHTFSASGADASGYLSQSALWSSGRLLLPDTLALTPFWPAGPWATTPLGWQPWVQPAFQAPTYAPGLPLLMVIPYALGGVNIASLVVPLTAAVSVAATGAVARAIAGGHAGILAAVLLAVSPVFVYQSFQPMSDVPVTGAWMMSWWFLTRVPHGGSTRRFPTEVLLSGAAAAVAILIRPNLAPVAIVPALALMVNGGELRRRVLWFVAPVALAGIFVALLQWHWYGSPLSSGYGPATEIYSFANVWPNLRAYGGWIIETQPVLLLAPLALVGPRESFSKVALLVLFAIAIVLAYLAYGVFDVWSYLRFLLPAIAAGAVLVGVLGARVVFDLPAASRAPVFLLLALAVAAQGLMSTRSHGATQVGDEHRRMALAGPYLQAVLPPGAVVIAGEQSGAARLYTGGGILRWEAMPPEELVRALAALEAGGHPTAQSPRGGDPGGHPTAQSPRGGDPGGREVWWLLDQWEEPRVRAQFPGLGAAALDWPPAMEAGVVTITRAWRLADRDRFQRGARVVTDRLR